MEHAKALGLAQTLVEAMRPHCERIQIAGSLRRRLPHVKDIEIVAIPRHEVREVVVGLFGDVEQRDTDLLHEWAISDDTKRLVTWIKPATSTIIEWPPKPDARYWRAIIPNERIKVDIFLCRASNWGAILVLRTGPAEFSKAVVTRAKQINCGMEEGSFTWRGNPRETREETDVWKLLRIRPVRPEHREDAGDLIIVPARGL